MVQNNAKLHETDSSSRQRFFLQGTPRIRIQRSVVNAFIDSFFKWLKSSEYNAFLLRVKYGPLIAHAQTKRYNKMA